MPKTPVASFSVGAFLQELMSLLDEVNPRKLHALFSTIPDGQLDSVFNELAGEKGRAIFNRAFKLYADFYLQQKRGGRVPALSNAEVQCQVLVAYGAVQPSLDQLVERDAYPEVNDRCHLTNTAHHTFNVEESIFSVITSFGNIQTLDEYLRIVRRNSAFDASLNRRESFIVSYRTYLQDFNARVVARNLRAHFTLFTQQPMKHGLVVDKHWVGETFGHYFPFMQECSCVEYSREARENIERQILDMAQSMDKSTLLRYLSLGAGDLLQDYIIVAKLLLAGFKHLQVILVEPRLDPNALRQFSELSFLAAELGVRLSISHYKSIHDFREACPGDQVHLAVAIDFEDIFKGKHQNLLSAVMATQATLAPGGKFFFSMNQFQVEMTEKELCVVQPGSHPILKRYATFIQRQQSLQKETVRVLLLGVNNQLDKWLFLLPALKNSPLKTVEIMMTHPREYGYLGGTSEHASLLDCAPADLAKFFFALFGWRG